MACALLIAIFGLVVLVSGARAQDCATYGPFALEDGGTAAFTHCFFPTPTPPLATPSATPTATPTQAPPVTATPVPPTPTTPPSGGVVVNPGENISQVISGATSGAVVRVRSGTYPQLVTISKPITLEPFGDGAVTITGSCSRNNGIVIAASDVTVRGLTVTNTRQATIRINSGGRNVIDGNTLTLFDCDRNGSENEAGVATWYAGPGGQTIVNNTIDGNPSATNSTQANGNGVWFKSQTSSPSGGGHYVAGNAIRVVYDGIGGEVEDDPRGGFDRDSLIENNTIDLCRDDGISVEGGTQNVRVVGNVITRCAIGIANAPNLSGPVYFERNHITQAVPGEYGNIQCFKVGNLGRGVAHYTENTCILGPGADGWGQTNAGVNPIISRGNYISVGRYVIEMNSLSSGVSESAFSWEGDTLCTSDPDRFIEYFTGRYESMADFSDRTRHEQSGSAC